MKAGGMDDISIIIRNRNEADYIGFALQSCIDHFRRPEIIIMDNNSTDDSLEVARLFSDRANINIQSISDYTPGKAINQAVDLCNRDIVLVLSAHCQIQSCDIDTIKSDLKHHLGLFGKQTPIFRGKKISKRYIWSHFGEERIANLYSEIEARYFFHNAFSFFSKEVLIKYPMPEKMPGKEDRFWASEIVRMGHSYLYEPTIEVNHFYTKNGATWQGIG